jgi:hypothetical protein
LQKTGSGLRFHNICIGFQRTHSICTHTRGHKRLTPTVHWSDIFSDAALALRTFIHRAAFVSAKEQSDWLEMSGSSC